MLTPKQLLVIMYQFRGVNAKKNVKKTYNDYAEKHKKSKVSSNSAWCSETIAASFIKAGALGLIGGLARQSDTFVKQFKVIGIWKAGHDRIPKVGDILIRGKNNDPYHSEVVFSVDEKKGTLKALSGNYLGNVGIRTRNIHDKLTYGYGSPKYDAYKIVTPSIVQKVMMGLYGKGATIGTTRYNKLALEGYDPDAVQAKINWVINTAQAIKDGQLWAKEHYGNDEKRKKALGSWYPIVQKQINVLYGIDKW